MRDDTQPPHRPTLRELEVLATVVRLGKTTAAAHALGISQPAVSRAIASLEDNFGCALFVREGGRLTPSAEGLRIAQEVGPVFEIVDGLRGAPAPGPQSAPLRIAAPPTLAHRYMPALIAGFVAANPEMTVHMEIGMTEAVIAAVANGNAHVGISDGLVKHDGLTSFPYMRAIGHVVMRLDHPLAGRERITPADFEGQPFIALTRRFHRRYVYDRIFAEHGVRRRQVAETATSIAVCEMVRAGMGLGILNPFPVCLRDHDVLAFRPFDPVVDYLISLIAPLGPVAPLAQQFIAFARAHIPSDPRFMPA